jgi:hypothetical protein
MVFSKKIVKKSLFADGKSDWISIFSFEKRVKRVLCGNFRFLRRWDLEFADELITELLDTTNKKPGITTSGHLTTTEVLMLLF